MERLLLRKFIMNIQQFAFVSSIIVVSGTCYYLIINPCFIYFNGIFVLISHIVVIEIVIKKINFGFQ